MSGSVSHMALECKHCTERADPDAALEAYLLHFQIEHDTDHIEFNLVAVCRCGATMRLDRVDGSLHQFVCPACGGRGSLRSRQAGTP